MLQRIYLLCLIFPFLAHGQSVVKDAGLWTSISLERKFSDRVTVALSEEFRFNENISELGSFFTDAGISFKINDDLKLGMSYRFINKRRLDNSYSSRHRVYADLSYRKKFKDLTLTFRARIQEQQQDIWSSEKGSIPDWYCRPKLALKYNIPGPWSPVISSELFYSIGNNQWDNIRMAAGFERKLTSSWDLNLFYMHQREFGVKNPGWDYIAGLGFSYSL